MAKGHYVRRHAGGIAAELADELVALIKEDESEDDLEAAFARFNERQRFGSLDVKFLTLRRDGYRCCACGRKVTNETSQVDHIVPVKRFASFAMASFDDNLQTLCLDCHKEKHHAHAS